MPAVEQSQINLLGQESLEETPIGRIVTWATTYGRYIMIMTEIVVLLAFISRFSLDRKRADLDDAIESKKAIIEANQVFESQYRTIQEELNKIRTIIDNQEKPVAMLQIMKSILPQDIMFTSYAFSGDKLSIKAKSKSTEGFRTFINNIQSIREFYRVDIGEISKTPTEGIAFQFQVSLTPEKKPKAPAPAAETSQEEADL